MEEVSAPTILGRSVTVCPLTAADEPAFLAGAAASSELHSPWLSPPRRREDYAAYIGRTGESFVPLGSFRREDRALLGAVNISQIFFGPFCSAYLGFYAFEPHAGRGYMRETLQAAIHFAFEHLGLHRLEANIQPDNHRSLALVERSGFEREGFSRDYLFINNAWRDHERWAIRREIWRPDPEVRMLTGHGQGNV